MIELALGVLLLLFGLPLAYGGLWIYNRFLFFIGFVVGFSLGAIPGLLFLDLVYVLAGIVLGVVFGFLIGYVVIAMLIVLGAVIGAALAFAAVPELAVALVGAVVGGLVAGYFHQYKVMLLTAGFGALCSGAGLALVVDNLQGGVAAALVVFGTGVLVQLRWLETGG